MDKGVGQTPKRMKLLMILAVVVAVGLSARTIDQSPTFQTCMHERKHDAAYRTMYEGGFIASRWTRLFLQADCIKATLSLPGR